MSIGPVEYIAIAFPGNKFSGKIVPALQWPSRDSGTIQVLGLVLIHQGRRTATSPPSNCPMRAPRSAG